MAMEHKYEEANHKLKETIAEIEGVVGTKHTAYHLFIYQRLASVQKLLQDDKGVEQTFQQCVETANKIYPRTKEDAARRFLWQNNLLKFYLENDVDKACDYGSDLLHDLSQILPNEELADLKFTLGVRLLVFDNDV